MDLKVFIFPLQKSTNTPLKIDLDSRAKNLTLDQVKERINLMVSELKTMEEYHHGEGMKYQKAIGDMYWDYPAERTEIGDYLSDLGYAGQLLALKMCSSYRYLV